MPLLNYFEYLLYCIEYLNLFIFYKIGKFFGDNLNNRGNFLLRLG